MHDSIIKRTQKMSNMKLYSLLLIAIIGVTGCVSVKPSTTKSGKNLYETFYVGEEGTQYFIKPMSFESSKSNSEEKLLLDFTFRYKDQIKDSTILNLSIKGNLLYKKIDRMTIKNTNTDIEIKSVELLFNEKKSKEIVSRFTTSTSLLELKELFDQSSWQVSIFTYDNKELLFQPSRKAEKSIQTLRDNVFVIM